MTLGIWANKLKPASFRGVRFVVVQSSLTGPQKTALHTYPQRDTVWVEPLGLDAQRYSFRGFLVGDDVFAQRDAMRKALSQPGSGPLVHPSIGTITATCVNFSIDEDAQRGRTVELSLQFVADGGSIFPSSVASTPAQTASAASAANYAAQVNFAAIAGPALLLGAPVIAGVSAVANAWALATLLLIVDAGRAANAVSGITALVASGANFGRYAAGNLSAAPTITPIDQSIALAAQTAAATTALIAASDASYAAVTVAAATLQAKAAVS